MHQHVEPGRAARRRPAREEGGREGPDGQAAHQDLARAGLARGHRVPDQGRACCPTSRSSASTSPPTAARPASATPATSTRRSTKRSSRTTSSARAVLSGNRNFEARIHPNLKANFLASPPLVVAYAIAGTVLKDLDDASRSASARTAARLPRGHLADRRTRSQALMSSRRDPPTFRRLYGDLANANPMWKEVPGAAGPGLQLAEVDLHRRAAVLRRLRDDAGQRSATSRGARALGIFGDSVTTDHISPGRLDQDDLARGHVPAWSNDVAVADFNSYGARRGNHEVMMRGTFANVRIKNLMLPPRPTARARKAASRCYQPGGEQMPIYDAAMTLHRGGHADGRLRRRGVRHRLVARLGGEGHAAPRREGGHRAQLRAHPPLQPGRHGRAAAAVQGQRQRRSRSASRATRRSTSPGLRATSGRRGRDARDPRARTARSRKSRCCCASTRRSRSTTTSTAASCRSCCAS